jgi:AraC-like DNA-binding protein/quercetin dioxygenase-like cupin family protein
MAAARYVEMPVPRAMADPDLLVTAAVIEHGGGGPFHTHAERYSELAVVLRGTGRHVLEGEERPLSAGDVFVIHGDRPHAVIGDGRLAIGLAIFRPGPMAPHLAPLRRLPGYHALFVLEPSCRRPGGFRGHLHLDAGQLRQAEGIIAAMLAEGAAARPGWPAALVGHFLLLAVHLCRWYGDSEAADLRPLQRLGGSLSHLEERFAEPVAVADLAAQARLSAGEYHRVFRRATGTSPIRYLNRLRIRRACALLASTDAPVTDIGLSVGYNDSNYFSRQFRAVMGQSPRQYRRRAR